MARIWRCEIVNFCCDLNFIDNVIFPKHNQNYHNHVLKFNWKMQGIAPKELYLNFSLNKKQKA